MQFKTFATAVLGFAAGTQAALSAAEVTVNIKTVTTLSGETRDLTQKINQVNIFSVGPRVIDNFRKIVQTVSADITAMANDAVDGTTNAGAKAVYAVSDQQNICNAFRDFVVVHQQLLATVIGKNAIFANTPFTAPMAAVLRAVEGGVDTLAFGIIDAVPTCAGDATANKNKLDASLDQSIRVYSS